MLNATDPTAVRNHHIALVSALAEHLRTTPDADAQQGLMALVLHVQGTPEELDADERELLDTLTDACA